MIFLSGHMSRLRKLAVALSLMLVFSVSWAQKGVFKVKPMGGVQLPKDVSAVFCIGDSPSVLSSQMILTVRENNGTVLALDADTALREVEGHVVYAVRHPKSKNLFYNKTGRKGDVQLFEIRESKSGKKVSVEIRLPKFKYSIEHPTFSADGNVMVFESDNPVGFGGRDLWYSVFRGEEWQVPQNMGRRVNSVGDDVAPTIYGDFLIYVSNGRNGRADFDLYSTRLIAAQQSGDTVSMFPIGRSTVCDMGPLFCGDADERMFAVSDDGSRGWWLRRGEDSTFAIWQFDGRLDCINLCGNILSDNESPVGNCKIEIEAGGDLYVASSGSDGCYSVLLNQDGVYKMTVSAPYFCSKSVEVKVERNRENDLYCVNRYNIVLTSYVIDSTYTYNDLFNTSVSSEISRNGRKHISALAAFLKDNPYLMLEIVSNYNESDDEPFCALLNMSRAKAIKDYIMSFGLPAEAVRIMDVVQSTREHGLEDKKLAQSLTSAAELSSQTVLFTFRNR